MKQRYNLFCDQRCLTLIFGNEQDKTIHGTHCVNCTNEVAFYRLLDDWLKKLIKNDLCIYFAKKDIDIDRLISPKYVEVKAAGGLVINEKNEILFIFRSGVWDLPKGHVELNETDEHTALREVEEETGLASLQLMEELVITRHFYFTKGKWEVKMTKWFLMLTREPGILRPQFSEGIEKAEWIPHHQLEMILRNAFRSLRDSLEFEKILLSRH